MVEWPVFLPTVFFLMQGGNRLYIATTFSSNSVPPVDVLKVAQSGFLALCFLALTIAPIVLLFVLDKRPTRN